MKEQKIIRANISAFHSIDDRDKESINNSVFSCQCEPGRVAPRDKGLRAETGGRELLERKKRKVLKEISKTDTLCVNYD